MELNKNNIIDDLEKMLTNKNQELIEFKQEVSNI